MRDVFIIGAARTPIGSFLGSLSSLPAPKLGAAAIAEAIARAGVARDAVEQVYMGNVLQAGQGQAPARQAMIYADLPKGAGATTVHKVCGSGMKSVMLAGNDIRVGECDVVVAGGMESMSLAPHLLENSRTGYRMGATTVSDSMIKDGLWDPYADQHMGNCAELCAAKFGFTREQQDEYALSSYRRAQEATKSGLAAKEIVPVLVPQRKGDPKNVAEDEEPFAAPLDKMPSLKPAFKKDGTVTAASSSKISDGAAALVLASEQAVKTLGARPLARLVGQATASQEPQWFTTAPPLAIRKLLDKTGHKLSDIDLFEVNEAFAVVAMAAIAELDLDPQKVNVLGGAVALGHPIGASGARIMVTLLNAMAQRKAKLGIAAICIGGGEATAVLLERC